MSRGGGVATTTLGALEGEVADCSGQSTRLNSQGSGVQAQRCHFLAVCLGASVLTQSLVFLICAMGLTMPSPRGCLLNKTQAHTRNGE